MPRKRKTNQTVLMVSEGAIDEAFLKYLKSIYLTRDSGVSVRIINAHGGSPESIVDFTIRQKNSASYNRVIIVMDTDIEWLQKTIKKSSRQKITLIGSEPCIEGLMLKILGITVPESSNACKQRVAQEVGNDLTDPRSYQSLFEKDMIEDKKSSISELVEILNCFERE